MDRTCEFRNYIPRPVAAGTPGPCRPGRIVLRPSIAPWVLPGELPPNYFPFVQPGDPEWSPRYKRHNPPGMYHNGGIWPFICGFHVAAMVAAGRPRLARRKLKALTDLVHRAKDPELAFGFNEYLRTQDSAPCGHDWQSWSAAMYLYAAACVEQGATPFFDKLREPPREELQDPTPETAHGTIPQPPLG